MRGRLIAFDGGLATFGCVVLDVDGPRRTCVDADVFTSEPDSRKGRVTLAGDRVQRTRRLARWLDTRLARFRPQAVAAEEMSFPRGANPIVCISLAWGVVATHVELRELPLVTAPPLAWRKHLHRSGRELHAQGAALVVVPSAREHVERIAAREQSHALDALGVAVWSLSTDVVRAALGGGA